ncbi:hypothetical protein MPLSOD_280009 [Mesorhizobium sp. SOD10]|nr:hypothetical protein MPLSOD_280009 [Mesorhizobium sp. SOD10]
MDFLAALLDSRWRIPGTNLFGLDALVGLVPILGDAATGIVSAYIVLRARSCGAAISWSPGCWGTYCSIRLSVASPFWAQSSMCFQGQQSQHPAASPSPW